MALEKGPADLVGTPLPATIGEVDSHAKCVVIISVRSSSPQRAKSCLRLKAVVSDVLEVSMVIERLVLKKRQMRVRAR